MSRKTRKLMWSVPIVAALAIVGALAMFAAQGMGSVFANPLPDAPMNLKVTAAEGNAGRTTLVLTWDAAANATGYRIDKAEGNGFMWETLVEDTGDTMTTYSDDTLTASDSRWYRVFALNDHGESAGFDYAKGGTKAKGKPGPVQNLRAVPDSKDGRTQLNLSWDPPADNGGEKIIGYELQYHNGAVWASIPDAQADPARTSTVAETTKQKGTTYEDDDALEPGDSRNYRVRAVSGTNTVKSITAGNSAALGATDATANDVSKDWVTIKGTTQSAGAPGQVTGLAAVAADAGTINLFWHTPKDDGGWDITDYLIQVRRQGKSWPDMPTAAELRTGSQGATDNSTAVSLGTAGDQVNATEYVFMPTTGTQQIQAVFTGVAAFDHDGKTDTADEHVRWEFRVFALTTDSGVDGSTGTADDVIRISTSPSSTGFAKAAARPDPDTLAAPTLAATTDKKEQIDVTITAPTDTEQSAYRIDYSEDGRTWMALVADTRFTSFGTDRPYEHVDLPYDATRQYRAFAHEGGWRDSGQAGVVGLVSAIQSGNTTASTAPGKVTGVMASVSADRKSITASWTAPTNDGGQPITKYEVQYTEDDGDGVIDTTDITQDFRAADTGDDPPLLAAVTYTTKDAATMATFDVTPTTGLKADKLYFVRVRAVNKAAGARTDAAGTTQGPYSDVADLPTEAVTAPHVVEGLTSKVAVDTNGNVAGVLVIWNEASSGSDATNYHIARKIGDGAWEHPRDSSLEYEEVDNARTDYTDGMHYNDGDEMRVYRVRAKNAAGMSDWEMVYYPRDPDTHTHETVPGAPTGVTATADSATQITVSWTAPANNGGAAITHYIIERTYDDDMVGDIPSDGYNAGVNGASFAFTDHKDWWETLNCKGMLRVFGSDADPDMDSDDKAMYCAHYAMSGPTADMTFENPIADGSDLDMKIEALFDKRYVITDDTMTTYVDMSLMQMTEYTYRVSAVNSEGRSMWSSPDSAMTHRAGLTAPDNVEAMVSGTDVTISWSGGENADTFTVVLISRDANGDWDIGNSIADQNLQGSPHTVDMRDRPSRNYVILVVAGQDSDDGGRTWSSWGTGAVDYQRP